MNTTLVTMTIDQIETKITELEAENAALRQQVLAGVYDAASVVARKLEEELNKAASFAVRCDHDNAGLRADLEDAEKEIAALKEQLVGAYAAKSSAESDVLKEAQEHDEIRAMLMAKNAECADVQAEVMMWRADNQRRMCSPAQK